MAELPTGTVTFLFTDVEGSTRLLHDLGAEAYAEVLAEHHRILREAIGQGGGVEVGTEGDAFFVAFPTAPGALHAARAAQSGLSIPVRMGIHTGMPLVTGTGYVGYDVHKAARIAASGHGGQVLVSAATAALLDSEPLRDLGEHRLKDLSAPERIYQLGDGDFPRLRTLHQTNLPVPATPFLGRERELAEVGALLQPDGARIVTLLGPGGTGKTRLAAQAAGEVADCYPDGLFWVSLAPLRDPALVLAQAGQAVGAANGLADHLADKRLLLLLDNFEQVISAARDVAALLASCPNLRVLVTSRELLRIGGEQAYPVPPLAPPDGVELFTTRARAADPAFTPTRAVNDVCAKLDNLPLALELAAARVRVLSSEQLLERLGGQLDLFRGGRDADPRQQTLRATIAWSHDLLDDEERRLFARLAVFSGGCTLEAVEEVADAFVDTLESLVDKSLLRYTNDRFWMLETIRQYARERLVESGEEAEVRRRQALFVLDLAETAAREIDEGAEQATRLARVAAEFDNVRGALEWTRDAGVNDVLLRLVAAVCRPWMKSGLYEEADKWLALALELERAESPVDARMEVLRGAAGRAMETGEHARADELIAEWHSLAEQSGDEEQLLNALNSAGLNAIEKGDLDDARAKFVALRERGRETGDRSRVAIATVNLGLVALESGNFEAGLAETADAVELFRELGDDGGVAVALNNCAFCSLQLSDPAQAEESFREALGIGARLGWRRMIVATASGLAAALIAQHEEERGTQLLAAAASLREELGVGFDDELDELTYDRAVTDAKAALGEEAFADVWARGAAMTEEAIVVFGQAR